MFFHKPYIYATNTNGSKKKNTLRGKIVLLSTPLLNYLTLSELNKLCKPDVKGVGTPLTLTKQTLVSKTGGPLLHSLASRKLDT